MITARDFADLRRAAEIGATMGPGRKTIWTVGGVALVHAPFLVELLDRYETTGGPVTEPDQPAVDVEQARALFEGEHCPMTDHHDDEPRPVEVVETWKLTTTDKAERHELFLGRKVPVRRMVVVRCTDEDCAWGQEVAALPTADPDGDPRARTVAVPQITHAGLGYTSVPPPEVGT